MATNNNKNIDNIVELFSGKHKLKLAIIIVLLIVCLFWYFKGINWGNMTTIEGAKQEIKNNAAMDTTEKKVVAGVAGVLTAAGGYEAYQIWRDYKGNEVPAGTAGAKETGNYVCADFKTQPEAQGFFERAGGVKGDLKKLDGDKNGIACQALPKK